MISKFLTINSSASSSSSEDTPAGQFNGRQVEGGELPSPRLEIADSSSEEDVPPKLLARLAEIEAMGIKNVICFNKQNTESELVTRYVDMYSTGEFGAISPYALLRLGFRDSTGFIHGLSNRIYERLSKIGFILKPGLILSQYPKEKQNGIILPMFEIGDFNMVDQFGWFCRDAVIGEKFNKIAQSFKLMQSLEKLCYQKIEKFDYDPVVTFGHANSLINQPNFNANKTKGAKCLVTIAHTESRKLDVKERMQAKQKGLSHAFNRQVENKKDVLDCLKHYEAVWILMSLNVHPCKAYAHMLFEALLNHTLDTMVILGQGKFDNNIYKGFIMNHLSRSFCMLAETLELLLPYAKEITKAFEIDLNKDVKLLSVFNIKSAVGSRLAIDEFQEYADLQKEVDGFSKKSKGPKAPAKAIASQDIKPALSKGKEEAPSKSLSLEQRKAIEDNKAQSKQAAEKVVQDRKVAQLTRREKEEAKDKRLQARSTERAEEVVGKHKQEAAEQEEAEMKKRLEITHKIHDLPSDELVCKLIAGLRGHNAVAFKFLFAELENDNVMNDEQVLNLANFFKGHFTLNNIGCATDFFNYVKARIHRRHDSDTGDLLPTHFIDILRSCFVIFGIFPKGWEPKTKEDFDAMEKYLQRKIDVLHSQMKFGFNKM